MRNHLIRTYPVVLCLAVVSFLSGFTPRARAGGIRYRGVFNDAHCRKCNAEGTLERGRLCVSMRSGSQCFDLNKCSFSRYRDSVTCTIPVPPNRGLTPTTFRGRKVRLAPRNQGRNQAGSARTWRVKVTAVTQWGQPIADARIDLTACDHKPLRAPQFLGKTGSAGYVWLNLTCRAPTIRVAYHKDNNRDGRQDCQPKFTGLTKGVPNVHVSLQCQRL